MTKNAKKAGISIAILIALSAGLALPAYGSYEHRDSWAPNFSFIVFVKASIETIQEKANELLERADSLVPFEGVHSKQEAVPDPVGATSNSNGG